MYLLRAHSFGLVFLCAIFLSACGGSSGGGGGGGGGTVSGTFYVSSTALDDSGDGLSPANAKRTIQAALNAAAAPSEIRVNAGTYTIDSVGSGLIFLKEDVSLYGGYSADFSVRDPAMHITTITDTGSGMVAAIIWGEPGITRATVIDGISLNASTTPGSNYTIGIYLDGASPTISNCAITGGMAAVESYGIWNNGGAPLIEYNTISGGSSGGTVFGISNNDDNDTGDYSIIRFNDINTGNGFGVIGIHNNTSTPVIHNNLIQTGTGTGYSIAVNVAFNSSAEIYKNIIDAGQSSGNTTGVFLDVGTSVILTNNIIAGGAGMNTRTIFNGGTSLIARNNTLYSGDATASSHALFHLTGTPIVENNILLGGSGVVIYGIYEDGFKEFNAINNNDFFGFTVPYYDGNNGCAGNGDGDNDAHTCTIAEMEMLADITNGASGNITDNPMLADIDGTDNDIATLGDNDWHFSGSSPASVTSGGLNGLDQMPVWSFTDDLDGVTRPASGNPWAMGAYEP